MVNVSKIAKLAEYFGVYLDRTHLVLRPNALKAIKPPLKLKPLTTDTFEAVPKAKNTVRMEQVSEFKFNFYDETTGKCIGRSTITEPLNNTTYIEGHLPASWFKPNGVPDERGWLPTYPRLYVEELVVSDKMGFFEHYQQRASGKKYGTMCMQRILEWAEKNGYGSRICLGPAKHGSNIHPGKFYAKIGFEPSPVDIARADKWNTRALRARKYAQEHPNLPEDELSDLLDRDIYEKIGGRFVSTEDFAGQVFLTHPEVLRNYPL